MSVKTRILNLFRAIFKLPFLEQILRKKTQNKPPNSFFAKMVPLNTQYPKMSYRTIQKDEFQIQVDLSDYIGHYLYFGFKDPSHQSLLSLVNEKDTVLDVGANIGLTVLQMAQKTQSKIYGFEPDQENFDQCKKNISLNNRSNVTVENIGLGNKKGEYFLAKSDFNNSGKHKIKPKKEASYGQKVKIETIDNWIKQKQLRKIDLIKIDVEGFELQVLKGAEKTIDQFHPKLFVELDNKLLKEQKNSAKKLIQFLHQKNYILKHAITKKEVKEDDNFNACHFDIIAI